MQNAGPGDRMTASFNAAGSRLRLILGASAVMIGLALAGVPALAQKPDSTLVYDNISGPGTLDPYVSGSLVELEIIHHLYEGLVEMDEHYAAKPMLASHIETSPDAKVFTFTLRHGVKFSNGKEMTSADVLASFQRYQRISTNASILATVDALEAPDPYTFIVRLKEPNPVFLDVLKSPTYPLSIMPAEQKDKAPREADVIGTGPLHAGDVGARQPPDSAAQRQLRGRRQFSWPGRVRRPQDGQHRPDPLQFRSGGECQGCRAAGRRCRRDFRRAAGSVQAPERAARIWGC